MSDAKIDAGKVIEKVEAGKDVTPAEQRAYDKAVQQAVEDAGYEPFRWSGRTMFRPLGGGDLAFDNEDDAIAHVTRSRVHMNLTNGVGA